MGSAKAGIKYLAFLLIMAWVFFLGILVGRGTAPVKFNTKPFQKRLADIKQQYDEQFGQKDILDETDLNFYKALEKPVPESDKVVQKEGEIIPGKVSMEDTLAPERKPEQVPLKVGLKRSTAGKRNADVVLPQTVVEKPPQAPAPEKRRQNNGGSAVKNGEKDAAIPDETGDPGAIYTVQIAAFKDFREALSQMADLDEKGFSSYRTKTVQGGVTWYRVRCGTFKNFKDAGKYLKRLKADGIDGMIIQKE